MHQIGWLTLAPAGVCMDGISGRHPLTQQLAKSGYVLGQTVAFVIRCYRSLDELDRHAVELASRPVDLIYTTTLDAAHAARRATGTIPIVAALVADLVLGNLADTVARPGAN